MRSQLIERDVRESVGLRKTQSWVTNDSVERAYSHARKGPREPLQPPGSRNTPRTGRLCHYRMVLVVTADTKRVGKARQKFRESRTYRLRNGKSNDLSKKSQQTSNCPRAQMILRSPDVGFKNNQRRIQNRPRVRHGLEGRGMYKTAGLAFAEAPQHKLINS
jgi:hypothetical protein